MGPRKRMMCIQLKKEIIEKHDRGARVVDLAKKYERSTSTICTILKQKESLRAITPAKGVTIISKLRSSVHENMERLLAVWLAERELAGEQPTTEAVICAKARAIYDDLQQRSPGGSTTDEPFKASRGWLENFKKRTGIHSGRRGGDASGVDAKAKAAARYRRTFAGVVASEGYVPQQVFNCDETGLFWRRMPRRTYITVEEKRLPGHKPMKDRLNLALCANASGDCRIKPLLVYHSETPRAFKSPKVHKDKLPVLWRANPWGWVTRRFFVEWVNQVFGPQVKEYLLGNDLPLQALLVLDNGPAHPPNLEEDLLEEFHFIKVLYLPPGCCPALQPVERRVVPEFKKLFTKLMFRRCLEATRGADVTLRLFWRERYNILTCIGLVDAAWRGVARATLTSAWRDLWPEAAAEADSGGLESDLVGDIVSLGESLGLDVDEADVHELMEEHGRELTAEELKQAQLHAEALLDAGDEEEEGAEAISTSEIKEILGMWEKVSDFIQKKHPETVATGRATVLFHDTCLTHFRNLLQERTKRPADGLLPDISESEAKRAKLRK